MAILICLVQKTFIPYQGSGLLCTFFVQETSVQFCLREFRRIRRPKMSELNARAWHCFKKRNELVKHILLSFQRTWLCAYRTYRSCARNNFFFFFREHVRRLFGECVRVTLTPRELVGRTSAVLLVIARVLFQGVLIPGRSVLRVAVGCSNRAFVLATPVRTGHCQQCQPHLPEHVHSVS